MCREINWNFTLFCIKINKVLFTHQICIVISVSFSYAPSHIIIKLAVIFHPHPQRSRSKARQTLYPLWCHQINYATTLPLIFNQLLVNPHHHDDDDVRGQPKQTPHRHWLLCNHYHQPSTSGQSTWPPPPFETTLENGNTRKIMATHNTWPPPVSCSEDIPRRRTISIGTTNYTMCASGTCSTGTSPTASSDSIRPFR